MIHVLPEIVYLSNSAGINNSCFQIEIVRKIGGTQKTSVLYNWK